MLDAAVSIVLVAFRVAEVSNVFLVVAVVRTCASEGFGHPLGRIYRCRHIVKLLLSL